MRSYLRPTLLAIDEVGYLGYDAHAADLLFQVVSRRYEQKSIVITPNLPCKRWDSVTASPIASGRPSRRRSGDKSRNRNSDHAAAFNDTGPDLRGVA